MRAIFVILLCLAMPCPSWAWGFEAHRYIADQMIRLLPPELRPLFEKHRALIMERSVDPDMWRTAGFESEPPNHFLDLDHEAFGPYPYDGLPRDYATAVQKFGREFIHQQGLLPWRVQEIYGQLQRSFEALSRRNPSPYTLDNIAYFSAILAHYVSDGHVPLHAVVNYDGQLTNQRGLHGRWESDLFEQFRTGLSGTPAPVRPVRDPRTFMFDVLLASNRLVPDVLAADKAASAGREFYDEAYYAAFRQAQWPVLNQRILDSTTAVASVIVGAWEAAGRPAVPTAFPRTPRRVPRP
jgi:hypothetical protein